MTLAHLLILAIVQGITEFLPVSSSGHLILLPAVMGFDDQGTALDIAVHVGTLGAVMLYFCADMMRMIRGIVPLLRGNLADPDARLTFLLVIATIPVVIFGLALKLTGFVDALRSPVVVGWSTLIFGLVLYWADRTNPEIRTAKVWTVRHAITMGLWQAIALIPGASRSGVTISGARALGYTRTESARLAMLMSIPTILASGTLLAGDVVGEADWNLARQAAIAAAFAFVAALVALILMMRLLRSISFTPYVVYRIFLAVAILGYAYL
ncbi:undecaprenyl-diphosphate phosphatase [Algicella marina]|uniref:Undecaprenyl-diphosphatase n=1 Tax=Algicella marina TaxID=2683284 RepID=A0A6P1T451_9RHOB|nr:undecaprenyl-diphosphate phosphatase [Algicella marina]QHQ36535.1 undecaprenyl-diphosphate phosphatase [Algicella marina]